tara:strand:+ start:17436 stop:18089 length:654 start_codon:yes stop_codon:yes gene_type:complete
MLNKIREPVSAITHFIGMILAIIGFIILFLESTNPAKPWHIIGFSIFGFSMILTYTASTLYHWLNVKPRKIILLKKLDQATIYVLIAATYTPICLIPLRGIWGWSLLCVIWLLAISGVLMRIFWSNFPDWFSVISYLFMGWVIIIASWPLIENVEVRAIVWIISGGLLYTIGAIIHAINKPNPYPEVLGAHEIFHVFVMLGSFSHFWVMYKYISQLS